MIAQLIIQKILRLIQSIAALFRRALCIFRKKQNIGELPTEIIVDRRHTYSESHSTPPPTSSWDTQWDQKVLVETKIDEWRKNQTSTLASANSEPDFFTDMAPNIKTTKKVIRVPKPATTTQNRNLFGYQGETPQLTAELGELDDSETVQSWDNENDLESALSEHRLDRHKARLAKHEQMMAEKRLQKSGHQN